VVSLSGFFPRRVLLCPWQGEGHKVCCPRGAFEALLRTVIRGIKRDANPFDLIQVWQNKSRPVFDSGMSAAERREKEFEWKALTGLYGRSRLPFTTAA